MLTPARRSTYAAGIISALIDAERRCREESFDAPDYFKKLASSALRYCNRKASAFHISSFNFRARGGASTAHSPPSPASQRVPPPRGKMMGAATLHAKRRRHGYATRRRTLLASFVGYKGQSETAERCRLLRLAQRHIKKNDMTYNRQLFYHMNIDAFLLMPRFWAERE